MMRNDKHDSTRNKVTIFLENEHSFNCIAVRDEKWIVYYTVNVNLLVDGQKWAIKTLPQTEYSYILFGSLTQLSSTNIFI